MVNDKPLEQIYVASFPEKNLETVLVLADGSKIDLERQVSRYILQENVIIEGEKGQLAYREQEKYLYPRRQKKRQEALQKPLFQKARTA